MKSPPEKDNMSYMNRHPFLIVDYDSSARLSSIERRNIERSFEIAGVVMRDLVNLKIISSSPGQLQVSVLICGDTRIRELNSRFRHKDKVTDVLSFPAHPSLRQKKISDKSLFLGDLAICHPQAKRQAKKFGISYFDEFIHLFFHGLIHLLGYDHELSASEERLMQKWEDEALSRFSRQKKKAR